MNFPDLPRRRFLKTCVAAGSAAMVLSAPARTLAAPAPTRHATPVGTLLVLDAGRAAILEAFAAATIAAAHGFPPVRDTDTVQRIDEELFFTDAAIRDDFLLAIDAVDYLPLLYGRFSRLHRMAPDARRDFLDSLADTRFDTVRAIVNGLRMITGLVYYAHPATRGAMRYEGPHAGLPPQDSEQRAYYRQRTGGDA